jgi:RNA methyltransferase, TrmH family
MISKNQIKSVTALHHKKFRREENLFIAEGEKVVNDLLASGWNVISVYGTQEYFQKLSGNVTISKTTEMELVTENELKKITALTNPQTVLAVAEMPREMPQVNFDNGLKLVLDGISDPGNLGTLIRIADWFGMDEVICSHNSVECFNPKVVQAAMGSLFRVKIIYDELVNIFEKNKSGKKLPVYGTVLDGKNI